MGFLEVGGAGWTQTHQFAQVPDRTESPLAHPEDLFPTLRAIPRVALTPLHQQRVPEPTPIPAPPPLSSLQGSLPGRIPVRVG